jgi:hypothetical protein
MKARTRGQKKAAKRGRPKLPAAKREPSGIRPSRRHASIVEREGETRAVVAQARARVHGVPEPMCERPEAGYVLGRLFLAGFVTKAQLDAGNRMAEDFARYYALTGIQPPSARAQNLFRVRGEAPDRSGDAARRAANAIMRIEMELGMVDHEGRPVTSVTKRVCLMDDDSAVFHGHMIGFLCKGLDALVVHYGLPS